MRKTEIYLVKRSISKIRFMWLEFRTKNMKTPRIPNYPPPFHVEDVNNSLSLPIPWLKSKKYLYISLNEATYSTLNEIWKFIIRHF